MMLLPAALAAELAGVGLSGVARWAMARVTGWLTGSWAWAIIVVGVVVGGLVLWHWFDPPEPAPPMFSAADVELALARTERESLQRALERSERTRREREAELAAVRETTTKLEEELGALREKTDPARRDAVGLAADDPWLRGWQARKAGARGATRR